MEETITVERRMRKKMYLLMMLSVVVGMIFSIVLGSFSYKIPLLEWVRKREDLIFFVYLIISTFFIFNYFWKKPWKYLYDIVDATQVVCKVDEEMVKLPEQLKTIEEQMNKIKMSIIISQQEKREAENAKDELVMYVAHDIRTPLTSIIGYLSLLHENPQITQQSKEKYIKVTLDNAKRLEKLINDFFEITRYNMGEMELEKSTIDLQYMFMQMIDEMQPLLTTKNNIVNLHFPENIEIYADANKIARVFMNLLKNAVAYGYANKSIDIFAEQLDAQITIVFQNQSKRISKKNLDCMFERFNRLEDSRNSDLGGSGLGLAIAKEIVCLHNGDISAESEGDFVRFIIHLPSHG